MNPSDEQREIWRLRAELAHTRSAVAYWMIAFLLANLIWLTVALTQT